MATLGGEGDRAHVDLLSVAAAIAPEKGRAPQKDKVGLADLSERMKKLGGKSVFEADMAQSEDDLMVNFDEMRRVLDSEDKRVKAESDPKRRVDLEKRYNRLARRLNVYDKLLNNEGFDSMDPEEQREMVSVVGALPGFCESAVLATGGRVTVEQMQKVLDGKGGSLTRDEALIVGQMVSRMVNDPKFHNRLSKNLSQLTLNEDDAVKSQELADLRDAVKDEAAKRAQQTTYKAIIDAFEGKPEKEIERIGKVGRDTNRYIAAISEANKPTSYTLPDIAAKESDLIALVADASTAHTAAAASSAGGAGELARKTQLQNELTAIRGLKTIYTVGTAASDYQEYEKIVDATSKKKVIDGELKEMEKSKGKIAKLEGERSKYADKYKRKMELALSEEMKRYWNDIVLTNASTAAEAQAQKKAEEDKKIADHKEKQVKLAKDVLDNYLQLSFLKYKGGKAVGWDDAALKQFVKNDMLSRSPEQLAKDMFNRINMNKMSMPKDYAIEMKRVLKEMGVGEGDPPLSMKDMMNQIGRDEWRKWAEEKIPDVLGYAWARGYYFDRLNLKPAQAEFLQRAYKEDFFANALEAKSKYAGEAETLMGGEFMDGGVVNREKIKKILFGKDWTEGFKKLMKGIAYAGAGYVLGGGLIWDNGKYIGMQKVLGTLGNLAQVGPTVGATISRAGDWALNVPTEGFLTAVNGVNPAIQGGIPVPGTGQKPFIPIR